MNRAERKKKDMRGAPKKKRGQGRPVAGEASVGREALIDAALRLLHDLPPSKVTISSIAREAGADPALIRYYFGNRTRLFLAVSDRLTARLPEGAESDDPVEALTEHIASTARFIGSTRYMQRLMIDELLEAEDAEVSEQMRQRNLAGLAYYRKLLAGDGGRELIDANPMFLHLMILAMFDFFSSAEPLVRALAGPDADMETLAKDYEAFVTKVIVDGVRKR